MHLSYEGCIFTIPQFCYFAHIFEPGSFNFIIKIFKKNRPLGYPFLSKGGQYGIG